MAKSKNKCDFIKNTARYGVYVRVILHKIVV